MTDKQIIIDGINVAGCEYFNRFRNICHDKNLCCDCEKNQDCYYKQLARLEFKLKVTEADYEASEQEREALQMSDNEAREIVAELKAECKELKEKVKELNQGWIDCDKERNLQETNSKFRQRVINRYKRTLIEIKEITEENIRISESEGSNGVYRCGLAEQVLQKISEVLNG